MIDSMAHFNPTVGIFAIPPMEFCLSQYPAMTIRDVLADNLRSLRDANRALFALPDIAKAGGGSNGTLGRIATRETSTTIDKLVPLADVFGLEPWELLVPGMTPPSQRGSDWPFEVVDEERYKALGPIAQGAVQQKMMDAIKEQEELAIKKRNSPETGAKRAA